MHAISFAWNIFFVFYINFLPREIVYLQALSCECLYIIYFDVKSFCSNQLAFNTFIT